MFFHVLVMIQMNGAGVGAGVTRAGTICPDPEPEPPAHFTRAGAGAGAVPNTDGSTCLIFILPNFYLFLFRCFFHFGQVVSSTLSRSDGSQCCCTNAVALHA